MSIERRAFQSFYRSSPLAYSAFQIDEPCRHNQNLVGTFHGTSLLWSTHMKTTINQTDNYRRLAVPI